MGFAAQSHWGADLQRMVAIEEAGELIAALCQEQRGRVYEHEVREEVADVLITALQLVCIYGVDECLEDIARKTERLRQRVMKARGEPQP